MNIYQVSCHKICANILYVCKSVYSRACFDVEVKLSPVLPFLCISVMTLFLSISCVADRRRKQDILFLSVSQRLWFTINCIFRMFIFISL